MKARDNPIGSRIDLVNALAAWPGVVPVFARAAAHAALLDAGFLPGDEDAERALRGNSIALRAVLKRCGTPLCVRAGKAMDGRATVANKALHALAPACLPYLQQALFAVWDAEPDPRPLVTLLAAASSAAAFAATFAVVGRVARGDKLLERGMQLVEWALANGAQHPAHAAVADRIELARGKYTYRSMTDNRHAAVSWLMTRATSPEAGREMPGVIDLALATRLSPDTDWAARLVRETAACPELVP